MMRYYTRLDSFEPNLSHSVTLTEVADKLFTSLRHARTLLGKMHQAELIELPFYDKEAEIPRGKLVDIPTR